MFHTQTSTSDIKQCLVCRIKRIKNKRDSIGSYCNSAEIKQLIELANPYGIVMETPIYKVLRYLKKAEKQKNQNETL